MRFYKYEGMTTDEKWLGEKDDRRLMREKIRKISIKTDTYNQKLQRKAFFCVSDASEETVKIGIILREQIDPNKWLEAYLKAIAVELKDTCLEEVTFNSFRNMLQIASRND